MKPSAVKTGLGPAGALPGLTYGPLARPRLLEEGLETKT